jgi:ribonuclease E
MEESKNDRAVEKRMKDNLRFDRARVQMGKISGFGLLELSRQRRRTGVLEGTSHICEHCQGAGRVRSVESAALALLRALDEASAKQKNRTIEARTAAQVALYLLNEKRDALAAIEQNRHVRVRVSAGEGMTPGDFEINVGAESLEEEAPEAEAEAPSRRARRGREEAAEAAEREDEVEEEAEEEAEEDIEERAPRAAEAEGEGERRGRRRRGRRGGRRRRTGEPETAEAEAREEAEAPQPAAEERGERGRGRRRRRGRGRGRRVYEVDGGEWLDFVSADLKHLTPRPERARGNGAARPQVEAVADEAPVEEAAAEADVLLHPAVEPATEPYSAAPVEPAAEPEAAETQLDYEPDQQRRDKFFSRLSRWAKK